MDGDRQLGMQRNVGKHVDSKRQAGASKYATSAHFQNKINAGRYVIKWSKFDGGVRSVCVCVLGGLQEPYIVKIDLITKLLKILHHPEILQYETYFFTIIIVSFLILLKLAVRTFTCLFCNKH